MLARWARWSRIAGREGYISRRRARWPILCMLGTLVRQEGWLSRHRAQCTPSFLDRHRPSFTHHPSHTTLSHTIFHHIIFHTHTQLCHTPSFLHLLLCLSFLPRPRYNISGSLLEEVDLCGVIRSFNLLTSCIYR